MAFLISSAGICIYLQTIAVSLFELYLSMD